MAKAKGIAGLLNAAAKKTSGSSKSGTPVVPLPATLHPFVTQWFEGKEEEQRGETRRKEAEGQLTPTADEMLVVESQRAGKFLNSIRLGAGDQTLMFQRKNQWLKMGETERRSLDQTEEELLSIFGDEDYNRYFERKTVLKIDPEKLSDEQAEAISKALGAQAADILEAEAVIKPKEALMVDCTFNSKLREKQQTAQRNGLCVPYSPSYKR